MAMTTQHISAITDVMKEQDIPAYMGDEYFGIAWPTTWRWARNQLEYVYMYRDEGFQMIYNGEIGKFEGVRLIEQTGIPKGNYYGSGSYISPMSFLPRVNSWSDWAFFFGQDTVAEALVVPEEIRAKIPTDYGRSKGISWYYCGATALVHPQPSNSGWETPAGAVTV
jgi:hypothetical protein